MFAKVSQNSRGKFKILRRNNKTKKTPQNRSKKSPKKKKIDLVALKYNIPIKLKPHLNEFKKGLSRNFHEEK